MTPKPAHKGFAAAVSLQEGKNLKASYCTTICLRAFSSTWVGRLPGTNKAEPNPDNNAAQEKPSGQKQTRADSSLVLQRRKS